MLTIIIPTLNVHDKLPDLLKSIGTHSDVSVIVSDGGSSDDTVKIAIDYGAVVCAGGAGRGAQLSRGADWALHEKIDLRAGINAQPSHLLFLHADCQLPQNWRAIIASFIAKDSRKSGYFRYKSCQTGLSGLIIKLWVDLRCWAWRLPYGDQGLLIPTEHYRALGGYKLYPLFEDVEFVDRIRAQYGRKGFGPLSARLRTDISDHLCQGVWRRGWRNFTLLRAYRRGATPDSLYARYHSQP